MITYNTEKSFADNMDALFAALEEQRQEHIEADIDQADKWVAEVIEHVQNGIDHAKDLYKSNPVEAVCEVANAITISLLDELNFGFLLKMVRTDVFGADGDSADAFGNITEYLDRLVDSVGKDNVLKVERRCERCHSKYWFYFPALWNDGRDAEAIRRDTRRTNTNASFEFMCLSGLCDACWQVCFNKE